MLVVAAHRGLDVLQVGRRHIELPAVITVFGFKTHRRRLAGEARVVEMPLTQIDIDRGGLDHGVGHFRPLSITRQRHLLAYHGTAMSHEGLCQVF